MRLSPLPGMWAPYRKQSLPIQNPVPFSSNKTPIHIICIFIIRKKREYEKESCKWERSYKQNNDLLPLEIAHYFENQNIENNTRRSSRLNSSSRIVPSSSFGQKSVQYKANQLWSEIPLEIKSCLYFNSFKKMYKSHLNLLYI